MSKISFISLGCAKNLVNSEQMLYLLNEAGHEIVSDPEGSDAVVVNTCGFIESAKSEAIENILEMAELKREGRLGKIIVCGCLAQRYKDEIIKDLPEVDALLGVGSFGDIAEAVESTLSGGSPLLFGDKHAPVDESGRVVSTGPGWAYLKIAEGCDNRCAFCVIPEIRGKFRSRPMEAIISEAKELALAGVKELIIIAQDITRYGIDLYGKRELAGLLRELSKIDGVSWLRLHYLYPDEMDEDLIDLIADDPKILKYLDIPIQHINNSILKRMNRRGTGDEIRALFKKLRDRIPELVIRTSLIVGLPGEGEAEFEELCAFLRDAKIERAGVFPYSPEEGTPAAVMEDRADEETAARRAELVMEIQSGIMDSFSEKRLGQKTTVLCEGYDDFAQCWYGRSFADSPDVDGKVFFTGTAVPGEFVTVETGEIYDGDLMGKIIPY